MQQPPEWFEVLPVSDLDDPALEVLDAGERAAIALGLSLKADLILIDDRKGAAAARSKGFEVAGTLGILDLAAECGLVDLADAVDRLKSTNFRYWKPSRTTRRNEPKWSIRAADTLWTGRRRTSPSASPSLGFQALLDALLKKHASGD